MTERPEHYRVLQVDPAANPLVIQAAYRVLARIFHPDVEGDADQMTRINNAWAVLGDPRQRAEYDRERAGRHPGPIGTTAPGSGVAPTVARSATAPHTAAQHSEPISTSGSHLPPDHAGPPQGQAFGPLLRFGRYEGWTLGQVVRVDRPYLEWLRRVPTGRGLKDDIDVVLRTKAGPGAIGHGRHYETERQRVHTWTPGAPTRIR
jgi:curved DNA-binding protein CbpA